MEVVNLTPPLREAHVFTERVPLKSEKTAYTGMVYHFRHGSMGTAYLDLPGHIAETDDGRCAAGLDPADFYRRPANVVRLEPRGGVEYGITPRDLERAMEGRVWHEWMVVHALGGVDDGCTPERMTYLTMEAVDFIIGKKVKILFSDAWESRRLEGVFLRLFEKGVGAVCNLTGLNRLPADREFLMSVGFLPYPGGVTQIPVSVLAEI